MLLRRGLLCATALAAGCVFGYRSEAEVEALYPLTDVLAVRLDLPATPIHVVGDPMALGLEIRGEWRAAGGSAEVAKANARTPRLVYAVDGGFAELSAQVPLAVQGQVDFEAEEVRLPPDVDLEVRTELGHVSIVDVSANIGVDVGAGDVHVEGGLGGVAVRTRRGDVDVESPGNVDIEAPRGAVEVAQAGFGGGDVVVRGGGVVRIWLASDADLDLDLSAPNIRVQTRTVSTITSGRFRREVGGAHVKIHVSAGTSVEVRLREP